MLDWTLTFIAIAGSIALFLYAQHKSEQPPRDELRPRMIPWRFVMVLCGFGFIIALVHLANLFGIQTGPEHSPLMRF